MKLMKTEVIRENHSPLTTELTNFLAECNKRCHSKGIPLKTRIFMECPSSNFLWGLKHEFMNGIASKAVQTDDINI